MFQVTFLCETPYRRLQNENHPFCFNQSFEVNKARRKELSPCNKTTNVLGCFYWILFFVYVGILVYLLNLKVNLAICKMKLYVSQSSYRYINTEFKKTPNTVTCSQLKLNKYQFPLFKLRETRQIGIFSYLHIIFMPEAICSYFH